MKELRYTLLPDGTSDRALIPILTWLLINNGINIPIQAEWANLGLLPKPPKSLEERIIKAIELYPCDLLFVHRDGEKQPRQQRVNEIQTALKLALKQKKISIPAICVIPIRMLEAWLIFDETAIRQVATNPHGKKPIQLPNLQKIEQIPDPKELLCNLLREASELTGRHLKKFKAKERQKIITIPDYIDDFSPLRSLSAFTALEVELKTVLQQNKIINCHSERNAVE